MGEYFGGSGCCYRTEIHILLLILYLNDCHDSNHSPGSARYARRPGRASGLACTERGARQRETDSILTALSVISVRSSLSNP